MFNIGRIFQLTTLLIINFLFLLGAYIIGYIVVLRRFSGVSEEGRAILRLLGFTKGVIITLYISIIVHCLLYLTSIIITFLGFRHRSRLLLWSAPICLLYSLESILSDFTGGIFSNDWVDISTSSAMMIGSFGLVLCVYFIDKNLFVNNRPRCMVCMR